MASPSKSPRLPTIDEEDEEELIRKEIDTPYIEFLDTELVKKWPGLIMRSFQERSMRSMDLIEKIQDAFVKARPFHSSFAIQLSFDTDLESQLLVAWDILKNFQLNPIKSSPHITLACIQFSYQSKLEEILETVAKMKKLYPDQKIIPLSFSSIRPFSKARSPPQANPLVQFHLRLCDAMTNEGIEIGKNYRPGTWVPFCVVAGKVSVNRRGEVLSALQELKLPFNGYGVGIKLVEIFPKTEVDPFEEEGAVFLFRKVITFADAVLWRFSVPKEIAENEMYFRRLVSGERVDIDVWEPEIKMWNMVITQYMDYTYHIGADWKVCGERMRLVAGDVIAFYKLNRPNVFIFPYQYMIKIEKENTSDDITDNSAADDQENTSAEIEVINVADNQDNSVV